MTRRHLVAGCGLALALLLGAAASASAQARLRSGVDTTLVTVGDRITLTVEVQHPAGASVLWPDSVDLSPFEVVDARIGAGAPDGTTSTARLSLAAFELGEVEIPSLEVAVAPAAATTATPRTGRVGFEVVSGGTAEGADIREIRGPLSIPVGVVRLALWALLLVLLGAALMAAWRRWRPGRSEPETARASVPRRPPHELALEALDRLAASPLLDRGEVKAFHVEASEIVRRYVEDALGVPALELTTGELGRALERRGVPDGSRDAIRRFLAPSGRVKFAKVGPGPEVSRALIGLGREIVEDAAAWLAALESDAAASERAEADDVGEAA